MTVSSYEPCAIQFQGDVLFGAHRLHLIGTGTPKAWSSAAQALSRRIADGRYWSAWAPSSLLEVVVAEVGPDGAVVYMAGSLAEWRALAASHVGIPAIEAAARSLAAAGGRLDRASCQSRPLVVPDHDRIVGATTWPWPVRMSGPEVTTVRPIGTVSRCQLDVLATASMAAVRSVSDGYHEGQPPAVTDQDCVKLAEPAPVHSESTASCRRSTYGNKFAGWIYWPWNSTDGSVCFKDKTLKTLHTDLVGKLYKGFDPQDPEVLIGSELERWLNDKGL
jgi:hypothetical protein